MLVRRGPGVKGSGEKRRMEQTRRVLVVESMAAFRKCSELNAARLQATRKRGRSSMSELQQHYKCVCLVMKELFNRGFTDH